MIRGRSEYDQIVRWRILLPALFLVAILYGDIWIGVTIPLAILVLPLMFLAFPPRSLSFRGAVPVGAILLAGIVFSVVLQMASGHPIAGKEDAVVFLPIAYGVLTIIVFRRTTLPDEVIWRALVAGGLLTGAVMIVLALVLEPGQFLIPGQNYVQTDQAFQQARSAQPSVARGTAPPSAVGTAPPPAVGTAPAPAVGTAPPPTLVAAPAPTFDFTPTTDESTTSFYETKELVKNALGRSNYIAVFFVILFTVALFRQSWFAVVFAVLAASTLSRFAVLFIACAAVLWWLSRRQLRTNWLVVGFLSASLVGVAAMLVVAQFVSLPASFSARVEYWQSGIVVGAYSPIFGMPRSEILDVFNFSIVWNPHNLLLWALAISGLIGLGLYLAYLFVALSAIYESSKTSKLWSGVFFGLVAALSWSLVEIIAMTPAFDILLACLYCLARNRNKQVVRENRTMAADARLSGKLVKVPQTT
jgi:hypothetical protein